MLIKGALHVHSLASHDGQMPLPMIVELYRSRGFQFICVTEHSEDMSAQNLATLQRETEHLSGADFLVIGGIEYSCEGKLHIVGVGCEQLLDTSNPAQLVREIRKAGAFAVLAHPRRISWSCSPDLAANLNAVEVWNVRYDGKFLPSPQALEFFNRMKAFNPKLLAAVGDDLHGLGGFYPLGIHMSVHSLDRAHVLEELVAGRYHIASPSFRASASAGFSPAVVAYYRSLRLPLSCAKSLRERLSHVGAQGL